MEIIKFAKFKSDCKRCFGIGCKECFISSEPEKISSDEIYERNEDMSPDGKLCVMMQPDGDMIVKVIQSEKKNHMSLYPSVEFCTSGGRSRNTLIALRTLALAIQKDNEEYPI